MSTIGSLTVKLGLVTVEWDKATDKAKQQAKDLQKAFNDLGGSLKDLYGKFKELGGAVSLGAIGFSALLQQTLSFSDQINDLSEGFDVSIAKVLQFRDALQSSGVSAEKASRLMSSLFNRIEEAKTGNEATIAMFERIGISFEELSQMSPEDAINRVFQALADGSRTTFTQIKAIRDLLGRAGIGASVEEIAEKLGKSTAEYRRSEDAIKTLSKVADNLKTSLDNLKIAFAEIVAPFTSPDFVVSVDKFKAAMIGIASAAVVGNLIKIATVFTKLVGLLREQAKLQAAITAMQGFKGLAMAGAGTLAYLGAKKVFDEDTKKAREEPEKTGSWSEQRQADEAENAAANRREIIAAEERIKYLRLAIDLERQRTTIKIKALDTDKYTITLLEIEAKKTEEINKINQQLFQNLAKENQSEQQKTKHREQAALEIFAAEERAKNERRVALAQRDKEIAAIERQIRFAEVLHQFDMEKISLDREHFNMNEFDFRIAQETLAINRKTVEIQNQIQELRAKGKGEVTEKEVQKLEQSIALERKLSENKINSIKTEEQRLNALYALQTSNAANIRDFEIKRIELESRHIYMTEYDYKIATERLALDKKIAEIEQQIAEARAKGTPNEAEIAKLRAAIDNEKQLTAARIESINVERERIQSFSEGWDDAFRKFQEQSINSFKTGAEMFHVMTRGMESAIEQFVRTGKVSFKSLVQSMIQEMLILSMKAQAMKMISMLFGSFGTALSYGTNIGSQQTSMLAAQEKGFADGGNPPVGVPSIVGERGPELFIPKTQGTIVPNNRISDTLGGTTNITNNYIEAIDTKSFEDRLLGSHNAIWAANQYANKSLAVGRMRT